MSTNNIISNNTNSEINENTSLNPDLPKTVRIRHNIIELKNNGFTNNEVANALGINEHTVSKWWKIYNNSDLSELYKTSGRKSAQCSIPDSSSVENLCKNNIPNFVKYESQNMDDINFVFCETDKNNLIDFSKFSGKEISLISFVGVYDKNSNTISICYEKDITQRFQEIDYTSASSFEQSLGKINADVNLDMQNLGINIVKSYIKLSSSIQVETEKDLRISTFCDLRGSYEIEIPKQFKSNCGKTYTFVSPLLKEVYCKSVSISTYRKGTNLLNFITNNNISHVTVFKWICKVGEEIEEYQAKFVNDTLPKFGFNPETGELNDDSKLSSEAISPKKDPTHQSIMDDLIQQKIKNYNSKISNENQKIYIDEQEKELYQPLDKVVNISIDEVEVNSQEKDVEINYIDGKVEFILHTQDGDIVLYSGEYNTQSNKEKPELVKEEKFESNLNKSQKNKYRKKFKKDKQLKKLLKKKIKKSVAHIRTIDGEYILIASNLNKLFLLILSFLLKNNLLENKVLNFFTDGAKNINNLIKKFFAFRQYNILLDWYHLKHQCYNLFTLGLYGGKDNYQRNEGIRKELYGILFAGNVAEAINYLNSIDESIIKNQGFIDDIKSYLERKKDLIYSYALMKELYLQNSSGSVEKSNDILVSYRCKNKGMSWVMRGLTGITSILYLAANNEYLWLSRKTLKYELHPLSDKVLAKVNQFKEEYNNIAAKITNCI